MGPWFIIALHVIVSVFLIFVILLQPGKGDAMSALGGGSTTTVFGGRGSVTFLAKITEICAAIFMITSLTLAYRSSHSDSVMRANRNIAAQDASKKKEGTTPGAGTTTPALPTGQTAPAPATGGAAVPVPGNQAGGPAAPTAGSQQSAPGKQEASPSTVPAQTPPRR
jgi:preprotein translocase subunit SecG